MDFLRRELIGGLSLIVALAVFAESDYRLTLPVALLFVLGILWTAAVVIHALLKRQKPRTAQFSAKLAAELQRGFELRDQARLAKDREQLFVASQAFIGRGRRRTTPRA
jgi:uncharacterized membrane protein YciS (DUF1049 family)